MSEIIEKLQRQSVASLNQMLDEVLRQAEKGVVDQIGGFLALSQHREEILEAFVQNMNCYFDELLGRETGREEAIINFETLSIIEEEEMDVMVALEGMIAAARNQHLPSFISFNTRLNALIADKRVDEATNPLDPHQVASAFQEAIRPLQLDAGNSLSVYRAFNEGVLKQLDQVLHDANQLLIDNGVIPHLGMDGASKQKSTVRAQPRRMDPASSFGTVEEENYVPPEDQPELFSLMQNLLHNDAAGQASSGTPAGAQPSAPAGMIPARGGSGALQPVVPDQSQQVQTVDQSQLMEILSDIQKSLAARGDDSPAPTAEEAERHDIAESLGEMLKSQDDKVIRAIDRQSSDVINLVTMLYEAIWDDDSVPIPIKELIGRTQITIIKVALSDTTFFNREDHPARSLLNEFAAAGIGWTEVEKLEEDPLYKKIQELVNRILDDYAGQEGFFEEMLQDFKNFQAREAAKTRRLEQRILKAKERKERLEDIRELVTQKIDERVLGRDLHPFVRELLEGPFHKFMVMLVLKEGPGGNAWKQAINTIDVLLWSVQSKEHQGDRNRLATVSPRLLNNLRKAFRIASVPAEEIDRLIEQLREIQEASLSPPPVEPVDPPGEARVPAADEMHDAGEEPAMEAEAPSEGESLDEDDPYLHQVDSFTVGIWVEFSGDDDQTGVRCKLAAKINAIDKYIFVNRQGVKVVEKTRMGLARELKEGTVRIISDGLLFSRALETVIGNLRQAKHEQQTASAYQPDASTA